MTEAMVQLSPSTMTLFEDCPACFWRHFHGLKRPERPVATIASGLDRVIKAYFDRYRDQGVLPPLVAGKLPGRLASSGPRRLTWRDDANKLVVTGILDEVLELPEQRVAPLDHKTRGRATDEIHPAYQTQLDTYTLLLEAQGFRAAGVGFLAYYIPQPGVLHDGFPFTVDVKEVRTSPERAAELARRGAALVRQDTPPPPTPTCAFCRYLQEGQPKG